MWRKNALRLRNWSSIATKPHHGLTTIRCYGSCEGLPISRDEFSDALEHVFHPDDSSPHELPVGLAVSGGVDSMALAALYRNYLQDSALSPTLHAFIVDHRLRPESTEEAEWVAEELRSMGILSEILTPQWPCGTGPSHIGRLETEARILRYRALGRACRARRIEKLMLAHHMDDQAETVMHRVVALKHRSGLQSMLDVSRLPECEDIYGVHNSGGALDQDDTFDIPFPVERGGVKILRPLLNFDKSRLIATCEEHGVKWIEDKTNAVQTLTLRNAIRHINKNHVLPQALRPNALVKLAKNMHARISTYHSVTELLFGLTQLKLNIQTGVLFVRFPPVTAIHGFLIDPDNIADARNVALILLKRAATLVDPSKTDTRRFAPALDSIYPTLSEEQYHAQETDHTGEGGVAWLMKRRSKFTTSSILWFKWYGPSPLDDNPTMDDSSPQNQSELWVLTRSESVRRSPSAEPLAFPPLKPAATEEQDHGTNPLFHNVDGRFWISITNRTPDTMILRLFAWCDEVKLPTRRERLLQLAEHGHPGPYSYIRAALRLVKPAYVRKTLPALFRKNEATGEEEFVGFPTLDVSIGGLGPPPGCEWQVRYKNIDPGVAHTLGDIIMPGIRRADIEVAESYLSKMARRTLATRVNGELKPL